MARTRAFFLRMAIALAVCALAILLSARLWLPLVGRALVHDDGPETADLAIVLGGDSWGHRIDTAAALVRRGYVPMVLVSGPPGFYGFNEADLAISYATNHGYPREWFVPFPNHTLSTRDEAHAFFDELIRRKVRRVLIVTSDYHTARARRLFLGERKSRGSDINIRLVAAPDEFFRVDSWWRQRESQKTVFFEWSKTIATAFGY